MGETHLDCVFASREDSFKQRNMPRAKITERANPFFLDNGEAVQICDCLVRVPGLARDLVAVRMRAPLGIDVEDEASCDFHCGFIVVAREIKEEALLLAVPTGDVEDPVDGLLREESSDVREAYLSVHLWYSMRREEGGGKNEEGGRERERERELEQESKEK
jgi:hypothetical protein